MRFGFVTCVQLGLACMEEIYRIGGALNVVITLHDQLAQSKSGRVYLDEFCKTHAVDLVKVRHINDPDSVQAIRSREIDWLFIIGWSQIAGPDVLIAARKGCLGMHPTLLPEGRGRAAIPWAILKGLKQTGVTMFKMDAGVDTGPIVGQHVIDLDAHETATTLYRRVADAHCSLMASAWSGLVADSVEMQEQDEALATVWPGRKPEEGEITQDMGCLAVDRLVRAVTHPYPGAFIDTPDCRYRIWDGRPVLGAASTHAVQIMENGNLYIATGDGVYIAQTWAGEALPSAVARTPQDQGVA